MEDVAKIPTEYVRNLGSRNQMAISLPVLDAPSGQNQSRYYNALKNGYNVQTVQARGYTPIEGKYQTLVALHCATPRLLWDAPWWLRSKLRH